MTFHSAMAAGNGALGGGVYIWPHYAGNRAGPESVAIYAILRGDWGGE